MSHPKRDCAAGVGAEAARGRQQRDDRKDSKAPDRLQWLVSNGWSEAPHCWWRYLILPFGWERTPGWFRFDLFGFSLFFWRDSWPKIDLKELRRALARQGIHLEER